MTEDAEVVATASFVDALPVKDLEALKPKQDLDDLNLKKELLLAELYPMDEYLMILDADLHSLDKQTAELATTILEKVDLEKALSILVEEATSEFTTTQKELDVINKLIEHKKAVGSDSPTK